MAGVLRHVVPDRLITGIPPPCGEYLRSCDHASYPRGGTVWCSLCSGKEEAGWDSSGSDTGLLFFCLSEGASLDIRSASFNRDL